MLGVVVACLSWLARQLWSCWNNLTPLTVWLILLALLLDYMKRRKRGRRLPLGPTPLPFIGNLLLVDRRNPNNTLNYLEKKFGEAVSIQIGWKNIIVLSGYKMIKKTVIEKSEDFSDHPEVPLLKVIGRRKNCGGMIMTMSSNELKEQRKFFLSVLKRFGKPLRNIVSEEAGYLCSELKTKEGSPFDPENLTLRAASNVICSLIFGDRIEYSDEKFTKLMYATDEIIKISSGMIPQLLATTSSWLLYLPGPHRKLETHYANFSAIVKEILNEHKKTRDPTSPRDLMDMFIDEMEKAKGNSDSSFNEQNLINVILDVYAAGSKTTTSSLLWGMFILALRPEIQERVHEEINKVIGRARSPTMGDQSSLPYTCAVIHEILRYVDIVPVLFPYITHRDIEVGKYVIPKDTIVVIHLSSLMKDETMWEKPHDFYPEHFLDGNGQFVKRATFLPFSAGRHVCPGESLAKVQLFLFFTSLLQHFTFVIPENIPRPKEEKAFALIVPAPPFQISAIPR